MGWGGGGGGGAKHPPALLAPRSLELPLSKHFFAGFQQYPTHLSHFNIFFSIVFFIFLFIFIYLLIFIDFYFFCRPLSAVRRPYFTESRKSRRQNKLKIYGAGYEGHFKPAFV